MTDSAIVPQSVDKVIEVEALTQSLETELHERRVIVQQLIRAGCKLNKEKELAYTERMNNVVCQCPSLNSARWPRNDPEQRAAHDNLLVMLRGWEKRRTARLPLILEGSVRRTGQLNSNRHQTPPVSS